MNNFIKKTFFAIIIYGLFLMCFELGTSKYIKAKADFRFENKPISLVLGHSHPECAFNDSLIKGFKNFAQSGESYYYTYWKLNEVINQNPSVNNIFLEFTNRSLNLKQDRGIWGEKYLVYRYALFAPFLPLEEKGYLMRKNPNSFFNSFSISLKHRGKQLIQSDYSYVEKLGGYLFLDRHKTDSILNSKTQGDTLRFFKNECVTTMDFQYLKKIIDLANDSNKKIFLIRSPLHEKDPWRINEPIFQDVLKIHFPQIDFLDFVDFPASNDEFGDLNHLNYKGAKIFSTWFNQLIQDGLLELENKQSFIDQRIEEIKMERGFNSQ